MYPTRTSGVLPSHLEHFFTSLRLYLVHIQTEATYATKRVRTGERSSKIKNSNDSLSTYFWDLRSNPWRTANPKLLHS